MKLYSTVRKSATCEQTIEKSRFITHVMPVNSREEADSFVASIKKQYKDATHNVPCLVLGEKQQIQWASDDGEPQGTSGAPMLHMLVGEGLTNVCVVVTRYFGGIKLGTGGLVRAYTSSAKLGIEAAGVCDCEERQKLAVSIEYTYLTKLQNLEGELYNIDDIEYTNEVTLYLNLAPENYSEVESMIRNATFGSAKIVDLGIEPTLV